LKILITGAAGFIGSMLSIKLLERGDEVIGIDNLNDYYDVNLKMARLKRLKNYKRVKFLKLEIADKQATENLFSQEKVQKVMHLSNRARVRYSLTHPHAYVDSDLAGFIDILRGCWHSEI
jgi:UDP-glucuronate 4-epimerase